jgi:hypothetical protein
MNFKPGSRARFAVCHSRAKGPRPGWPIRCGFRPLWTNWPDRDNRTRQAGIGCVATRCRDGGAVRRTHRRGNDDHQRTTPLEQWEAPTQKAMPHAICRVSPTRQSGRNCHRGGPATNRSSHEGRPPLRQTISVPGDGTGPLWRRSGGSVPRRVVPELDRQLRQPRTSIALSTDQQVRPRTASGPSTARPPPIQCGDSRWRQPR